MTKLLEDSNIDVPYFTIREEHKLSLEQEDGKRLYALGTRDKNVSHILVSHTFISDLKHAI